jgi:hypothetical protein
VGREQQATPTVGRVLQQAKQRRVRQCTRDSYFGAVTCSRVQRTAYDNRYAVTAYHVESKVPQCDHNLQTTQEPTRKFTGQGVLHLLLVPNVVRLHVASQGRPIAHDVAWVAGPHEF